MRMIKPMMMMMTKKEGETHITIWTVRSASGQPTIYSQSPGKDYDDIIVVVIKTINFRK